MKIKRILNLIILSLALFSGFTFPVSAAEEDTNGYYEELSEKLPKDTLKILSDAGISDSENFGELSLSELFNKLFQNIGESLKAPLLISGKLLAVIIFCAVCGAVEGRAADIAGALCPFCCALFTVGGISTVFESCNAALKAGSGFMLSAASVYGALLASGGEPARAAALAGSALFAGNLVLIISNYILLPGLNMLLCFSVTGAVCENGALCGVSEAFSKFIKMALCFAVSCFTAIAAAQNAVSGAADAARLRGAKTAASGFIPVVGSAVSDAMGALYSSVHLLRSGAGAFGIAGIAALYLPEIFSCGAFMLCFSLMSSVSLTLKAGGCAKMLSGASGILSIMLGFLISAAVISLVICAVVLSGSGV